MQRNQVSLTPFGVEKNRCFLKGLYVSELEDKAQFFDILKSGELARKSDSGMTLDRFLEIMKSSFSAKLDVGSHTPIIRYMATAEDRFCWIECGLTEHNYGILSRLFKSSFGEELDEVPVPSELQRYHARTRY